MAPSQLPLRFLTRTFRLDLDEKDVNKALRAFKRDFAKKHGYPAPKDTKEGLDDWQFDTVLVPREGRGSK